MAVIGVDIGTSSSKGVLVTIARRLLAEQAVTADTMHALAARQER
jgi:sugar (pentulose or hexulose) kinase